MLDEGLQNTHRRRFGVEQCAFRAGGQRAVGYVSGLAAGRERSRWPKAISGGNAKRH
jgi:hypothetical protein